MKIKTGKRIFIKATLIEEMLGTANSNPDIHDKYIASLAPDAISREEEIANIGVEAAIEQGMTVFPRNEEGDLIVYDYQIKGFLKSACKGCKAIPGSESESFKAYKSHIDLEVFPEPRQIVLNIPEGGRVWECQRPLRAQTAQGERVALASSETVPAGTTFEFSIYTLNPKYEPMIIEWLKYGRLNGLGQWRNSGKGRFTFEILKTEDAEF